MALKKSKITVLSSETGDNKYHMLKKKKTFNKQAKRNSVSSPNTCSINAHVVQCRSKYQCII